MSYSNFGFYAPTTSGGTVGRVIESIQSIDNNDGIITFNILYTDGLTQSASHSLVSDSLINLNKLTLEGTNDEEKLVVKQSNGEPIFQVSTTEPGTILNGKTLINHDGLQYSTKFVIDANDGLLPCMRVSTVTNTTTIRDIDNVDVNRLKLNNTNGYTEANKAIVMNANNDFYVGGSTGTLISHTGIQINGEDGIQIQGDNNAYKLIVRNTADDIIFRVSTTSDTAFINNIDNVDFNKLKVMSNGYSEPNKVMITQDDNSIQMGDTVFGEVGITIQSGNLRVDGIADQNKLLVMKQPGSKTVFKVNTIDDLITMETAEIKGTNQPQKFSVKDEFLTTALSVNTNNNTTTILNIDNVDVNKLKVFQDGFADPNKAIITNNFNTFQLKNDINDAYSSSFGPEGVSIGGGDGLEIYGTNSSSKFVVKDGDGINVLNVDTSSKETTITLLRNEVYSNSASTGVVSGGILSIGTPNTTFSISDGYGYIVDTEVSSPITWTGKTNITVANLATQLVTYILIGTGGIVYQQSTYPTAQQQREKIFLGVVVHVSQTIVDAVDNRQVFSKNPISQLYDVLSAIGFLNVDGNIVSAFSNTLQIRKSLGKILASGANYYINPSDPHVLETPLLNPATFQYRMRNGFNYTGLTQGTIITTLYDVGTNVPATVPNNAWSIQRFYLFPSNAVKVMFSQFTYASKADALSVVSSESFVVEPSILANGLFIGYLIVKKDTTDLSNVALAQFYSITKFGATSSAGAASSNLQASYNLSESNPEILTNSTQGGVNIRRGSNLDTDIVFSIQNGAGTTVSSMSGEGVLTANKVIFKEYHHLPSFDMTGYNKDDVSQYFLRKCQPHAPVKTLLKTTGMPTPGFGWPIFAPYLNRIYLSPNQQSPAATWWYYDCNLATFVSYEHLAHASGTSGGFGNYAFQKMAYHTELNRIYLIPTHAGTNWHYIDGLTGLVVAFLAPVPNIVANGYMGGVYSPKEKRLYYIPNDQAPQTNYHYINSVGGVVTYVSTLKSIASNGGAYDATNNRIYIAPLATSALWYYIDCAETNDTIKMKSYAHGQLNVANLLSYNITFHPILNRLYIIPWGASALAHYIDCNFSTPTIVQFAFPAALANSYLSGFWMPTIGSIILCPFTAGTTTNTWKTIDYQGNIKDIIDTTGSFSDEVSGGFYDSTNDAGYLIVRDLNTFIKLDPLTCERVDRFIMAHTMLNNS